MRSLIRSCSSQRARKRQFPVNRTMVEATGSTNFGPHSSFSDKVIVRDSGTSSHWQALGSHGRTRPLRKRQACPRSGFSTALLQIRLPPSSMPLQRDCGKPAFPMAATENRVPLRTEQLSGLASTPLLAGELVARDVDVLVATGGEQVALAAAAATDRIPIIYSIGRDRVPAVAQPPSTDQVETPPASAY